MWPIAKVVTTARVEEEARCQPPGEDRRGDGEQEAGSHQNDDERADFHGDAIVRRFTGVG